jgi:hypothetical protein
VCVCVCVYVCVYVCVCMCVCVCVCSRALVPDVVCKREYVSELMICCVGGTERETVRAC